MIRTKEGYAWNHYQYIGPRTSHAFPPVIPRGQTSGETLPTPTQEREKSTSLAEELRLQRKGLQFLEQGSPIYQACMEKILSLEARAG